MKIRKILSFQWRRLSRGKMTLLNSKLINSPVLRRYANSFHYFAESRRVVFFFWKFVCIGWWFTSQSRNMTTTKTRIIAGSHCWNDLFITIDQTFSYTSPLQPGLVCSNLTIFQAAMESNLMVMPAFSMHEQTSRIERKEFWNQFTAYSEIVLFGYGISTKDIKYFFSIQAYLYLG